MITWITLGITATALIYTIYTYNSLISLENRVDNAWSQIRVQLKRRSDLIPNLVETAERYAEHEKDVFKAVSGARSKLQAASTPHENAEASEALSTSLGKLFAVAEDYPDLKADTQYRQVQEELSSTENKIAYARQHYNDITTVYNTRIESFPSNIIAAMFSFTQRELFQLADEALDTLDLNYS